ncbi:VanZ like family protein [Anaerobranca californiensis DSM 14826]|jgi:VanZ family protein|uniref:VanZ like family protein n=1 Tax=Anaerobranca californiensis DSM 14826 TaxID=1120989 RepID=A0A1M6QGY8_9FIRM|nr:VanZ family protein [Anaerobranca californiensis]SHK19307.1 VanZ like family protein [Anaerobranca californiensis DSM 14826]
MKVKAWLILFFFVGLIFYLSSIPGLQVLPVLRYVHSFLEGILARFDVSLIRFSNWLGNRLPFDISDLKPFKIIGRDFLTYTSDNPRIVEFVLRKFAHVVMFFFITLAFFLLASHYVKKVLTALFLAFLGGTTIAFLDEYRQSFVPSRVASLTDVFINLVGVTLALFFILFALFITKGVRMKEYYKRLSSKEIQKDIPLPNNGQDSFLDQQTKIYDSSFKKKVNEK